MRIGLYPVTNGLTQRVGDVTKHEDGQAAGDAPSNILSLSE